MGWGLSQEALPGSWGAVAGGLPWVLGGCHSWPSSGLGLLQEAFPSLGGGAVSGGFPWVLESGTSNKKGA